MAQRWLRCVRRSSHIITFLNFRRDFIFLSHLLRLLHFAKHSYDPDPWCSLLISIFPSQLRWKKKNPDIAHKLHPPSAPWTSNLVHHCARAWTTPSRQLASSYLAHHAWRCRWLTQVCIYVPFPGSSGLSGKDALLHCTTIHPWVIFHLNP
jgi:hypothetical protein